MIKTIIGIFIGAIFVLGGTAYAESVKVTGIHIVNTPSYPKENGYNPILKYYDYENNVVCYVIYAQGISCLHN